MRYRDERRDDEMDVTSTQVMLHRYRRDGTDLFQNPIIAKQSQFVVLLRTNDGSGADPSSVCSGKDDSSNTVVGKADE